MYQSRYIAYSMYVCMYVCLYIIIYIFPKVIDQFSKVMCIYSHSLSHPQTILILTIGISYNFLCNICNLLSVDFMKIIIFCHFISIIIGYKLGSFSATQYSPAKSFVARVHKIDNS